ncbi:MAG: hypothetical protein FWG78_03785 [Coriobacteriia bacterium]|nr:hypothetical protein [Coriobacteriia bacterium]
MSDETLITTAISSFNTNYNQEDLAYLKDLFSEQPHTNVHGAWGPAAGPSEIIDVAITVWENPVSRFLVETALAHILTTAITKLSDYVKQRKTEPAGDSVGITISVTDNEKTIRFRGLQPEDLKIVEPTLLAIAQQFDAGNLDSTNIAEVWTPCLFDPETSRYYSGEGCGSFDIWYLFPRSAMATDTATDQYYDSATDTIIEQQ